MDFTTIAATVTLMLLVGGVPANFFLWRHWRKRQPSRKIRSGTLARFMMATAVLLPIVFAFNRQHVNFAEAVTASAVTWIVLAALHRSAKKQLHARLAGEKQ